MEPGGFVHLVWFIWTGVKAVICILLLTKILVEKVLVWFQVDSGSIHSLCESKQINPTKDFYDQRCAILARFQKLKYY